MKLTNKIMLITYADSLGKNLSELKEMLETYFHKAVGGVRFLSAFPLYYMICGATNSSIDIVRGKLFPGIYLIENYQSLIANQNLGRAMFNSFRNAIVITVIALLICSIAGYGFEIYHDKGKEDRKSTRLNSSHSDRSRMPSSA